MTRIMIVAAVLWAAASGAEAAVGQDVAGMAMAGRDDRVYIWYRDGTASSGVPIRLDRYRTPYAFSTPLGQTPNSIVGVAIAKSNDRTYAWYANGQASAGGTDNLDRDRKLYPYTLPPGKTASDIIEIDIGAADHVFAFYKDGAYTEGTSNDLDAYGGPYAYKLAPGYEPKDVLGLAIDRSNRVWVWYKDGFMSSGSPDNLASFVAKRPYSQSLLLKSSWGPAERLTIQYVDVAKSTSASGRSTAKAQKRVDASARIVPRIAPEEIEAEQMGDEPAPRRRFENLGSRQTLVAEASVSKSGPAIQSLIFKPFDTSINGIDPMIAVGKTFVVASQYQQVEFFGKNGRPLAAKGGVGPVVHAEDLFAAFLWDASGATSTDINRHAGFPTDCNDPVYPQTSRNARVCVVEAYDVRAFNNPNTDRWIVVANLRNKLTSDLWSSNPDYYANEYKEATGNTKDMCGVYSPPGGDRTYTDKNLVCSAARRNVAIAVSKTADPRKGFHIYAISSNNYRDFPWATINGDVLLINNHGSEMIDGAVATGISISDLEAGKARPSYFQYFRGDVDNHYSVRTPQHGGGTDGLTIMYGVDNDKTTLYAFPQPTERFQKPPLARAVADIQADWPAYYRGSFFHMAGHIDLEGYSEANMCRDIRYTRLPVSRSLENGKWSIATNVSPQQGYRRKSFGKNSPDDPPNEVWSYEEPALAVNANDDVVITYGRMPVNTTGTRYPDARFTVWYHDETEQRPSNALISGQALPKLDGEGRRKRPSFVHHAGAAVDPSDPAAVWVTHVYMKKVGDKGDYQQFVARVTP